MKKIMLIALAVLSTSTAFAADSNALKAILASKTFVEAQNLVNSSLSQLANNEEKAKAYNKLVDLAMEKVNKEQQIIDNNMLAEQLKQGEVKKFDTVGFYNAIFHAIESGIECDKYDQMPNEKGKVKVKFHKANQDRLYRFRQQLINGGQEAARKNDEKEALNHFGLYVSSASSTLFADVQNKPARDEYLGEVARVASIYAFQGKKLDLANQYCDVALQDTAVAVHKDALNLKAYLIQQNLTSRADSLKAIDNLKTLYEKANHDEQVFAALSSMYSSMNNKDALAAFIAEKLKEDPNNFSALVMKGQTEMNAGEWDTAVEDYKKALGVNDKDALVLTYLGFTLNSKAQSLNDAAQQKKLYTESMGYLEKARDIDPSRNRANWVYSLYQCYYTLYGADDSRTKELEKMIN